MTEKSFEALLAQEVGGAFAALLELAADGTQLRPTLDALFPDITDREAAAFESALAALPATWTTIETRLQTPSDSLDDVAGLLVEIGAVVQMVRDLTSSFSTMDPVNAARLLVNRLVTVHLQRNHPHLFRAGLLLTLLDYDWESDQVEAPLAGPFALEAAGRASVRLDRMVDLLSAPLQTLSDVHFSKPPTAGELARLEILLLTWFNELKPPMPDAGEIRLLRDRNDFSAVPNQASDLASWTVYTDASLNPLASAQLALVPAGDGVELLLLVERAVELDLDVGPWVLSLSLSASGSAFALGAEGIRFSQAEGPRVELALTLTRAVGASPQTIGVADGTRLEMGLPELRIAASADGEELDVDLLLHSEATTLTLAAPEGLLRRLLPDEPLTVETGFGIGWRSGRGVYLEGGDGLAVHLPLHTSIADVLTVHAAHFVLAPADRGLVLLSTVTASSRLGPLSLVVERVGVEVACDFPANLDGNLGPMDLAFDFKPPDGVGVSLEVGPVKGGGFVDYVSDTGGYVGAMELQIGTLGLTAFGIIDTQMSDGSDGFSMLVLVTGRFTPIPIGFGFTLNAIGGLLGLHRDVDVDALFAVIRAGTARDLLAPENPVRDAPQLVRQASALFPVARGQHVFGPTLQLGWGSPKQVITLDLGLAVTLPDPLRFILIGTVRAVLPDKKLAIARLNVDIAGVLDLSASRFDLEGRIFDSVIQAIPITGGFAMRSSWGRDRSFVFSIGGVHPGFTPPANFPMLDRMGVDLSRGSSFQFRLGGYFAITSNSLQLGARADFKVRKGSFALLADIGFDALLIFDPFRMDLQIYAGASIKRGNRTLLSLRIEARLQGPGPWQISGKASFRILFLKVSIGFSKSFGQQPSELAAPVNAEALIIAALMNTRSWIEEGASHAGDIVLEGVGEALGPYSPLAVQQKVAPLELRLDQLGGRRLIGRSQFQILRIIIAGEELPSMKQLKGAFAPAQFIKMDERERLSAPCFEDLVAGASFAGDGVVKAEGSLTADTSMEMIILDAPPPSRFPAVRLRREMVVKYESQAVSRSHPAQIPAGRFSVHQESWVATDGALGRGEEGTYAQLRQDGHGTVLARMGEVAQ